MTHDSGSILRANVHGNVFNMPSSRQCTQVADQRGGELKQHLQAVSVVDAAIAVLEDQDVEPAEAALQAFAKKLHPTLELGPAH